MKLPEKLWYLRLGRKLRATGTVIDAKNGLTKVKPDRADWGAIWLTPAELKAGGEKPPITPREKKESSLAREIIRRPRKPKPLPPPRWKQLVDLVRDLETDHVPSGWPAVEMRFLTELADELEAAQTLFLPQQP